MLVYPCQLYKKTGTSEKRSCFFIRHLQNICMIYYFVSRPRVSHPFRLAVAMAYGVIQNRAKA